MSSTKYEINKFTEHAEEKAENRGQRYFPVPYERKTSLEIINEARASIKAVKTKRPFTPLERNRQLFGHNERTAWSPGSSRLKYYFLFVT